MARTVKTGTLRVTCGATNKVLSATSLLVTDFEMQPDTGNTGSYMYIGDSSVDNTYIGRAKGSITNFTVGNSNPVTQPSMDLSKWYVAGDNAADVAIIQYRILTEDV